jgi:hypothetical protein
MKEEVVLLAAMIKNVSVLPQSYFCALKQTNALKNLAT